MAFSKAPSKSTYQTQDVKLIWSMHNRDASGLKDTTALNGFYDIIRDRTTKDDDYTFTKRDGTQAYLRAIASNNIRGIHYWEDEDKLLVAYDDKIDIITGSTGVLMTTVSPFPNATTDIGFSEFNYESGETKVVIGDGTILLTLDASNAVVTSTDPDLPAFEPHFMFLDGYIFAIKTGTADIYNSVLDDPLSWTPGDFITTEMLPDTLFRIARLSNYLVAFGSASIEYFFDAGNASGTPLQRNDTPVKQIGYLTGFAAHSNRIYFVGQTAATAPEVYYLEDFKMETVDNPALRRHLRRDSTFTGGIVSNGGHDFYVLTSGGLTYALDLKTEAWVRWGFQTEQSFPIKHTANVPMGGIGNVSVFAITGKNGLYNFNPNVYQDVAIDYPVEVLTYKQTFDTMHEKFMSRLLVLGDKTAGTLSLSYTDDDYTTYSTPRLVSMSSRVPRLNRLGKFVERAFKATYMDNSPLRIRHFEIDFNIGAR